MGYQGENHSQRMALHQRVVDKAREKGVELTDAHWEAIDFVLDVYEACPECQHAREMSKMLSEEFKDKGGKRYLYQLFPRGPVTQIHDLANLTRLENERDMGFGTAY